MGVFHKDLTRLSRDAKKLRKEIRTTTKQDFSAQNSLDLIATFFQWNSWNEMYVAWESKREADIHWHDLRVKQKTENLFLGEKLLEKKLRNSDLTLSELHIESFLKWFSERYSPKNFSLPSTKDGLFLKARPPRYSSFSKPRFREGFAMISDDTQEICKHLGRHFIDDLERPGCVVYCKQFEAMDFFRVFSSKGYKTKILSDGAFLPGNIDAESLPLYLSMDKESPYSVDELLRYYVARNNSNENSIWYSKENISILVDIVILTREPRCSLYVPSLKELFNLSKQSKSNEVKLKAETLIEIFLPTESDKIDAEKGEFGSNAIERWQYLTMQITNIVLKSQNLYSFSCSNIGDIDRPKQGELLLIVIPGCRTVDLTIASMITKSLMIKFSDKMVAHSEDDIWVFGPSSPAEQSILTNENNVFDFPKFNGALANLVLYGPNVVGFITVETKVTITGDYYSVEDFA